MAAPPVAPEGMILVKDFVPELVMNFWRVTNPEFQAKQLDLVEELYHRHWREVPQPLQQYFPRWAEAARYRIGRIQDPERRQLVEQRFKTLLSPGKAYTPEQVDHLILYFYATGDLRFSRKLHGVPRDHTQNPLIRETAKKLIGLLPFQLPGIKRK